MAAISTILGSIAVAAVVGGTAFQAVQSNKARKDATKAAQKQQTTTKGLEKEFKEKTDPVAKKAKEKKVDTEARTRQRSLAAQAVGRRSTILTGPLGLTEEPESKGKVLLGT